MLIPISMFSPILSSWCVLPWPLIVCFRRTPIALISEAISAVMNGAAEGYSFYE